MPGRNRRERQCVFSPRPLLKNILLKANIYPAPIFIRVNTIYVRREATKQPLSWLAESTEEFGGEKKKRKKKINVTRHVRLRINIFCQTEIGWMFHLIGVRSFRLLWECFSSFLLYFPFVRCNLYPTFNRIDSRQHARTAIANLKQFSNGSTKNFFPWKKYRRKCLVNRVDRAIILKFKNVAYFSVQLSSLNFLTYVVPFSHVLFVL